jgi:hypothetical protein
LLIVHSESRFKGEWEQTKKFAVENSSKFKALAEKARKER